MVSQVFDEEGLDDGMEHGAGQEGNVAEDVDFRRNRFGRHKHDDDSDNDKRSPRDYVGEQKGAENFDQLDLLFLVFLLFFVVSGCRGTVTAIEGPTPQVLLEELRDELVGPDASDNEDTHRDEKFQDREDDKEVVVDPRVRVLSGESRQTGSEVGVKLVLPETEDGKEGNDQGKYPDAEDD